MTFERRGFRGGGFRSGGFRSGGFRSGGFREDNTPKPVNVGEEYDVEISEVGSKGDGIARVKNFVVFVNNGKKGEKTKIKIKEVRERFAIGEKVGEATGETSVATEEAVTEEGAKTEEASETETGETEEEGEEETSEEQ